MSIAIFLLVADFPFSTDVRVDNQADNDNQAEVSGWIEGAGGYASWIDMNSDTRYDISGDTGQSWGTDQLIPGADCCDGVARAAGDTAHIIWLDLYETRYMRSTNAGSSWGSSINISSCTSTDHPWVTTIGQRVAVIWADFCVGQARVAYSANGGGSWNSNNASTDGTGWVPFITSDDIAFYSLWWSSGAGIPIKVSSSLNGTSWTQRGIAATMTSAISPNPYPVGYHADGWGQGNMGILFQTGSLSNLDVEFVATNDTGATWSSPVKVADAPASYTEYNEAFIADPYGNLHAFWFDNRKGAGTWGLYYSFSQNGGVSWLGSNVRVSDTDFAMFDQAGCNINNISGGCWPGHYIDAAADSNYVYAIWADNRITVGGTPYYHIYFSRAPVNYYVDTKETRQGEEKLASVKHLPGRLVFTLSQESDVTLSLFSADGRLAKTVAKGRYSAGTHERSVGKLPAGAYVALLRAGSVEQTAKFVEVK